MGVPYTVWHDYIYVPHSTSLVNIYVHFFGQQAYRISHFTAQIWYHQAWLTQVSQLYNPEVGQENEMKMRKTDVKTKLTLNSILPYHRQQSSTTAKYKKT